MCLLITQPQGVVFDESFLRGVYDYNPDGIGVMYAKDNTLYHAKFVPSTFEEYVTFYKKHIEGQQCAWHSRLQTHGATDLFNAHPYEVISSAEGYPLYMMHNGVLSTGNADDKTKSDTWHFIQKYLRPMLLKNPEFFMDPAFAELIGDFIGTNNKFVFMDAYGNQVTINEEAFVEHNGAMLSNTYAWDTRGTEHDYKSSWRKAYNYSAWGNKTGNYGHNWHGWPTDDVEDVETIPGPLDAKGDQTQEEPEDQAALAVDLEMFTDFVFSTLASAGMQRAWKKLTIANVEAYYLRTGEQNAWELANLIEHGCYTDDEFIDEILGV